MKLSRRLNKNKKRSRNMRGGFFPIVVQIMLNVI